jgi:ABC-2 type transport system ATP-binding protein
MMIQTLGLTRRQEDGHLCPDHVSFKVDPGQVYCLLGTPRSGKTTIINLLVGLVKPTAGRALVNNVDCEIYPVEARKHLTHIPPDLQFSADLTPRQNLEYFAALGGKRDIEDRQIRMVMREVKIPERAFSLRTRQLPHEMRQRLGVALAMLKQTPVLLADEPTLGCDAQATRDFLELLPLLKERGVAILFCTRDPFLATQIADVAGLLKEGVLILETTRQQLAARPLDQLYQKHLLQLNPEIG